VPQLIVAAESRAAPSVESSARGSTGCALRQHLPDRYRAVVELVIGPGDVPKEVFGLGVEQLNFLRAVLASHLARWPVHDVTART
jgi:hypothetical protein